MTNLRLFRGLKASLLTLTIGGFSIGMTEFMMMGVLPDVSRTLSISIPSAGHLISIYALGVVVGAPLMTAVTGKLSPKTVLISLMVMCGLFNALFAISPNYIMLMASRFFAGLPHGAFFGMGAVVASRLAEPGREARTISLMFAGLTIANIVGVPVGTYIGHNLSWRISFVLIAVIAFIAAGSIKKWMPALKKEANEGFLKSVSAFKKPEPWIIILISAIGTGGLFAWISYIAPLMTEVAGFSANAITPIMIVAGIGMALGNFMGGRIADRFSPLKTTAFLLLAMVASLIIVGFVSYYKVPAIIMTFVTGALAFAVISPMQMLMIQAAKGSEMLASSAIQASSNMGNALGAFLGGLPLVAGFGYTSPQFVGAALALGGCVFCSILYWRSKKQRESQPLPEIALTKPAKIIVKKVQPQLVD